MHSVVQVRQIKLTDHSLWRLSFLSLLSSSHTKTVGKTKTGRTSENSMRMKSTLRQKSIKIENILSLHHHQWNKMHQKKRKRAILRYIFSHFWEHYLQDLEKSISIFSIHIRRTIHLPRKELLLIKLRKIPKERKEEGQFLLSFSRTFDCNPI